MVLRSIDAQKCKTEVATKMGDKNNYPDTLPYDYNRVVLSTRGEEEDSHYINASYVQVIIECLYLYMCVLELAT
jgi:protein tyrosine phosphatase